MRHKYFNFNELHVSDSSKETEEKSANSRPMSSYDWPTEDDLPFPRIEFEASKMNTK